MNWRHLDVQMQHFSARLISELKLTPEVATKLATTIASDVRLLPPETKATIRTAWPVPLEDRLAELQAFQGWMDQANEKNSALPSMIRWSGRSRTAGRWCPPSTMISSATVIPS
jgi:hypothetical protein